MRSFVILLLCVSSVYAIPSISGTTGNPGDGNILAISGTGFGTQPHSKPAVYADFEGPSNNPNSTLGRASAWDSRDNMSTTTASVFEGNYSLGSQSGWETTLARVRWDDPLSAGEKVVVAWWRRATYTVAGSDNWKWLRIWSENDGDNYPNWYHGQSPTDWRNTYVENCAVGTHRKNTNYTKPNSTWKHDEYIFQIQTTVGNYDGSWQMISGGTVETSSTTWDFTCSGQSGELKEISLQDDPSNFTPTGDVYYDLIYIDTGTWSRVYLSTSSILAGSRRFLQPYSAWADTEITITQEWGDADGTMYAFVCDNDNSCSDAFEVGSASPEEPAATTATGSMPVGDFTVQGGITFQ